MDTTKDNNRMRQQRKPLALDTVYVGISAAFIVVCTWISIPAPVPFTLQTFAVFFVTALFGFKRGTLAVVAYLLRGIVGLPVFSGFKGGIGVLSGATGGYIIGFIVIAVIVGIVSDYTNRKILPIVIAMIIGNLLCYLLGSLWFMTVYASNTEPAGFMAVISTCVIPFILPDVVKIIAAVMLVNRFKWIK